MKTLYLWIALIGGLQISVLDPAGAGEPYITVASTTSTQNSGLFEYILPKFKAHSGLDVRVVAVGTGQAIRLAQKGDADVLFVHHKPSEEKFVAEGFGTERNDIMYNDFVIVGPGSDPAGIQGMTDAVAALKKIARSELIFVSRGDDSGTNKKELGLWKAAGIDVKFLSGSWYRETGSGMGATLNAASGMGAYTLTDRATWISFNNKQGLALLSQGDTELFNQYGVILVSKKKHSHVKSTEGQAFIDWLTSPLGQSEIASFKVGGQQLFFPNASNSKGS